MNYISPATLEVIIYLLFQPNENKELINRFQYPPYSYDRKDEEYCDSEYNDFIQELENYGIESFFEYKFKEYQDPNNNYSPSFVSVISLINCEKLEKFIKNEYINNFINDKLEPKSYYSYSWHVNLTPKVLLGEYEKKFGSNFYINRYLKNINPLFDGIKSVNHAMLNDEIIQNNLRLYELLIYLHYQNLININYSEFSKNEKVDNILDINITLDTTANEIYQFLTKNPNNITKEAQNIQKMADNLTNEEKIIKLVKDELTLKQIAERMNISYKTLTNHKMPYIYDKFDIEQAHRTRFKKLQEKLKSVT